MTHAQYHFQGISLSEALIQLDQSSNRYDISFVYDELEDFKVTKTIKKSSSLLNAVREVCGFYPVRITTKGHEIFVECIQKDRTKLSGKVVDADSQPIAYANIVLYDASDTLVIGGGVSNEAGDFVIPCRMSQAKVRISCVGFKTIERQMPVADVGTIRMQMDNRLLQDVTVSGRMPVIRNEANRLQYIVGNDEYAQGLTALELLHRVPMVSIDNGHATILGRGTAHYMMNGRVMEMDDEVVHQRLWTMHAEDIERIEVITMPTGKYLTDLGGGYINFVLNRDQSLGWRSDLSVQAGASDRCSGRTDASVNYASEKLDVALDVNGSWLTKTEDKDMDFFLSDIKRNEYVVLIERNSKNHKETEDKELDTNLMLRYQPTKNQEIGFLVSYQYLWPKSDIVSENFSPQISKYSKIFSKSSLHYAGNHVLNLSAYSDWTLGKPESRLSFSYNYYHKQDNYDSNVFSKNITTVKSNATNSKSFTNESSFRILSTRIDFSAPLSVATTLNLGVSFTSTNNEPYASYLYVKDGYFLEEKILAGYLSFQQNFNKHLKAMAALRYEHAKNTEELKGDLLYNENYNHFFPALSLNYRSDNGDQMGVDWAMGISRPNFKDLSPLFYYNSYYDISGGNIFLEPSFENRVEMNYTSSKGFYANYYYTHGKDQIDRIRTIDDAMVSSSTPSNCYKSHKTGLYLNYNHSFLRSLNVIAEGEIYYYYAETYHYNNIHYSWGICGDVNSFFYTPNKLNGWGKRFSVCGDISLNRQHSFLLNVRYDQCLDDYVGLSKIDAYGYFTFVLRYSPRNDRLKFSLTAVDPFRQHVMDKTTKLRPPLYRTYRVKNHTNCHSHYIGLTATYSFGGKKVRQIHHDIKNDEIKRAEAN